MKKLLIKYKSDIIFLAVVTIIFLVLSAVYSKYFINIFIDLGREAYFPELMLRGNLLYKDLFNIFGPLGYQINAILYQIFGIKMSTLGIAGNICSLLILYFIYFISKIFLSTKLSIVTTLFVLVTCIFSPTVFNFIYPYSYSLLYAYTSFMGAVLFFLLAFKNKQNNYDLYLFISYFLMGISLAAKVEYIPFVLILVFYNLFVLKQSKSKIILNFISILMIPLISYGYLFYQGVTIDDFIKNLNYIKKFVSSEGFHIFYSTSVGSIFSLNLFKKFILPQFFMTLTVLLIYILSFFAISCSTDKPKYFKPEYAVIFIGLCCSFLITADQLYLLTPYLIYGIFIYEVAEKIKNKNFDIKNDIFFIFIVISLISMLKTAFILDITIYGQYSMPLLVVVILHFALKIIPKFNKIITQNNLENLFLSILLMLMISDIPLIYNFISEKSSLLHTDKVDFYMVPAFTTPIRELFEYIDKNVSNDKSMLFIPDGAFINYAKNRDMKLYKYQSLLPPYIDAFGVENIINDIKETKTDYIVFVPRSAAEYSNGLAICDFQADGKVTAINRPEEKKLCSFIENNYDLVAKFDLIMFLKLKNNM